MNTNDLSKFVIFTTSWCGPCGILKAQLKSEGIEVRTVVVDESEDNTKLANELDIKAVPTLVEYDDANNPIKETKISGSNQILRFLLDKSGGDVKVTP